MSETPSPVPVVDQSSDNNPYIFTVIPGIVRLVSLLDRNRFSDTFGCFDRPYWHYRTLIDFASPTYQEGSLALALLWSRPFAGNFLYQHPETLDWTLGAMTFWTSLQRPDGSFDEWFPYEHSFVATAFSACSVSESLLILDDAVPLPLRNRIIKTLEFAAKWLSIHDDFIVANHAAGAAAALWNIYRLTGSETYCQAALEKIRGLKHCQASEGWFPEYGGADPGYQSMTIDYLARIYSHYQDTDLYSMLKLAIEFLDHFVHPDGSSGGAYGRRNTIYLVPHGLELMAGHMEVASMILQRFYQGLQTGKVLLPHWMDDRYFVPFFSKFCQALVSWKKHPLQATSRGKYYHFYPKAGLLSVNAPSFTLISSLHKGGIFKLFVPTEGGMPNLYCEDSGYFMRLKNGKLATTQWYNPEGLFVGPAYNRQIGEIRETTLIIKTSFVQMNTSLPLRRWMIPFRLFNYTIGRLSGRVMDWFNRALKHVMITRARAIPASLERTLIFSGKLVKITDRLKVRSGIQSIGLPSQTLAMHVPSSRYYVRSPTYQVKELENFGLEVIDLLNNNQTATIERQICFDKDGKFDVTINGQLILSIPVYGGKS